MGRDLRSVAETYLGERHFESLSTFFKKIWTNTPQYRYRVFMARRCFNLNEVFMKILLEKREGYDLTGMMSNQALLLQAEDVARRYVETGKIDPILIVDDIIIHGRTIQKLLYDFEETVGRALERLGAGSGPLYGNLHKNLTDAVSIQVYLANKGKFLLSTDYFWRLSWVSHVERIEWQEISQRISWLLQDSEIANTSFVISALSNQKILPISPKWKRVQWRLRERKETVYFSRLRSDAPEGGEILLSVRSYPVCDVAGNRRLLFVPFVFGGESHWLSSEELWPSFTLLLRELFEKRSHQPDFPPLRENIPATLRVQLVHLFFSAVVLRRFCEDMYGGIPERLEYDLEKVGRNFGAPEIGVLLKEVLRNSPISAFCERYMQMHFQGFSEEEIAWEREEETPDDWMRFRLNRDLEDLIFKVGLESEREAFLQIQEYRIFYPENETGDVCSFYELIGDKKVRQYPLCYRLASALMLADAGVGSLTPKDAKGRERLMFRAGEQALFCKARQYTVFIPALITIENQYYQYGKKAVIDQAEKFQAYLEEHLSFDRNVFSSLGELIREMYSVGQQVGMWNINLLFSVEPAPYLPEPARIDQLREVSREQDRIQALCGEYLASQRY